MWKYTYFYHVVVACIRCIPMYVKNYLLKMRKMKKNEIWNEKIFFLKYLEIFKIMFLKFMVYIHITKITNKIIDCFKLCTFVLGETIECLNRDHKHYIENHAGICFEIFE